MCITIKCNFIIHFHNDVICVNSIAMMLWICIQVSLITPCNIRQDNGAKSQRVLKINVTQYSRKTPLRDEFQHSSTFGISFQQEAAVMSSVSLSVVSGQLSTLTHVNIWVEVRTLEGSQGFKQINCDKSYKLFGFFFFTFIYCTCKSIQRSVCLHQLFHLSICGVRCL